MFLPGTKVVVVASGVKKSSGPRVGSLGYYIDGQEGHYFPECNCYAASSRVAFVRYGYEEKPRFEIKEFIFFVPVKDDETPKSKSYKKWATKILEEFDSKDKLDIAMNYSSNSPKSTYYGVLAPITTDLRNLQEVEWKAWLTSMVMNRLMTNLTSNLSSPNGTLYFKPNYPLGNDWHNTLMMLCNDKGFRKTTMKELFKNQRKETVEAVRVLAAVSLRHHYNEMYLRFRHDLNNGHIRFRNGDLNRSTRAVQVMVNFIFSPKLAEVKDDMASIGRKELAMLAKNMDLWRSVSKAKARELVCSQPESSS